MGDVAEARLCLKGHCRMVCGVGKTCHVVMAHHVHSIVPLAARDMGWISKPAPRNDIATGVAATLGRGVGVL